MTSATIEQKYTTNSIIKNWLTLKSKLNLNQENVLKESDINKFHITVE